MGVENGTNRNPVPRFLCRMQQINAKLTIKLSPLAALTRDDSRGNSRSRPVGIEQFTNPRRRDLALCISQDEDDVRRPKAITSGPRELSTAGLLKSSGEIDWSTATSVVAYGRHGIHHIRLGLKKNNK